MRRAVLHARVFGRIYNDNRCARTAGACRRSFARFCWACPQNVSLLESTPSSNVCIDTAKNGARYRWRRHTECPCRHIVVETSMGSAARYQWGANGRGIRYRCDGHFFQTSTRAGVGAVCTGDVRILHRDVCISLYVSLTDLLVSRTVQLRVALLYHGFYVFEGVLVLPVCSSSAGLLCLDCCTVWCMLRTYRPIACESLSTAAYDFDITAVSNMIPVARDIIRNIITTTSIIPQIVCTSENAKGNTTLLDILL